MISEFDLKSANYKIVIIWVFFFVFSKMSSSTDYSEDEDCFDACENDDDQYFNLKTDLDNKEAAVANDLYEFYTLKPKQILEEMMSNVYDVIELLNVSETLARLLMNHFKWDSMELINAFVDCMDGIEAFLKSVSLPVELANTNIENNNPETESLCEICLTEKTTLTGPKNCLHRFCEHCWTQYLQNRIFDEGKDLIELYC